MEFKQDQYHAGKRVMPVVYKKMFKQLAAEGEKYFSPVKMAFR